MGGVRQSKTVGLLSVPVDIVLEQSGSTVCDVALEVALWA